MQMVTIERVQTQSRGAPGLRATFLTKISRSSWTPQGWS